MRAIRCLSICFGVCLSGSIIAQAADKAPKKITSVEGITEYHLDNGLTVLLFPDESKPTVTVNVTYLVGSRHEGYGETGMAHLLEHMVFKGTDTHPTIWKDLQDHGATFNGSTSFDRTNYFETMNASDENLDFGLQMEADRMVNSHIARKDLDSEFSVVRNEFEMGENNPVGVLEERIMSTAYLWHNYGKSTIGSREDIERVPIDRLKAFYQKYYQPDNALLIVAGKFDEKKTLTKINDIFGAIPRPTRTLDKTYTMEPVQDGEREVSLRRVGDVQAIGTMYHIPAASHEDMPAIEVLADIMDADQTGRLYKTLIDTHKATQVRASAESLYDPGVISFSAQCRVDQSLDDVRKILLDVVENPASLKITPEEVDRAKVAYEKSFDQLMNNSGRVGIVLSEWAASGDWRLMFLHRDRMKKVTPKDVERVAQMYLKPSNRTLGTFVPTKSPERTIVPPAPDLIALLKDYHGEKQVAAGEAFDANPEAIEARTQRGELSCGIKTALLPKKTRGERVSIDLTLLYGSESALKGKTEAAGFLGAMLERGTTKHTRREIQDEFDKLKATVRIGFGGGGGGRAGRMLGMGGGAPGALSVNIETNRENLSKVITLVTEMLREPAFPAAEFDKMQKQMLARIEQGRSEPNMLASNALRRKMSPYSSDDVRYVPSIDEQIDRIKAVKLDDIKQIYKDLIGASHGELAAVGDFDAKELSASFDKALKGWKSSEAYERIAMPYHEISPEDIVINTPDKAMALILSGTAIELRDDDADAPAMVIGNMILGQGGNSRLINRLRQKEGYSYSVSTMLTPRSEDRASNVMVFAICAPQNNAKAAVTAHEEIARFLKDGITQKELDDAKKGYAEQLKVQLSNDDTVAGILARQAHLGRTMKFAQDQSAKIAALTLDEVNTAIRKYLSADKFINVRAGDLDKKADDSEKKESKGAKEDSE
jgi:zinc protease